MKRSILNDELTYLRSNPGTTFYVKFDYCEPYKHCTATVEPPGTFPYDNEMWRHLNARTGTSDGRVQLHAMSIGDCGCDSTWIFPLCCATAECRTRVEILAAETTALNNDVQADRVQIQHLADLDILEVHI
jgi:hypothetical protein